MPTQVINLIEHYYQMAEEQVDVRYKVPVKCSEPVEASEAADTYEEQQLTLLPKFAAEGFLSLDQGKGIGISSESDLRNAISSIGHRAATAKSNKSVQTD